MDSSNTIKEFFENQGGIKMELNTISDLAIAGVICSVVLSMGVPIALFIAGRVKLKARISSFFIGAGTYLLFAMLFSRWFTRPVQQLSSGAKEIAVGAAAACSCHSVLRTERTEQAMALLCVRGFGCSGF